MAKIEDRARIDKKLAALKTGAARIECLLRELGIQNSVDAEGRIRTLSKPAAARGRNAKNIPRILREGKKRYVEAKTKGVDCSVLSSESKIRKRVEAAWQRRINPPPARGDAGRRAAKEAGTTTKRKNARLALVVEMLHDNPKLRPAEIAEKFGCGRKTADRDLRAAKK